MNKECAKYLNDTVGRWNKDKANRVATEINKMQVVTEEEGKHIGRVVAQWAKDHSPLVEDTEVLCDTEDGYVWVGVRLYGGIEGKYHLAAMNQMKALGLMDVETIIGLEDDGYVTICGHGPIIDKRQKMDRIEIILNGIAFPTGCSVKIDSRVLEKSMLWITSNKRNRAEAAKDIYAAEKLVRKAVKGLAVIRIAERYGMKLGMGNAYWVNL